MKKALLLYFCLYFGIVFLTGCNFAVQATPPALTILPTSTETASPLPTFTLTLTLTLTPTPLPTVTPAPTGTFTPSPEPTYAVLRGKILQRANCRYGPGAPYLYKYGIIANTNMDMIARNQAGSWVFVQAIGGDNPCWVNADLVEIKGDIMALEPVDPGIIMPWSPYYGALKGISAVRDGDKVTVFWSPLNLRAGDDSEQTPYLIEAWVCQAGQIVFTPLGFYQTAGEVPDEAGCSEPSHARIYGAEKHGYTPWVEIPWPAHPGNPTPAP